MTKKMSLRREWFLNAPHINLLIERDAGNEVLILMGKPEYALPAWKRLRRLSAQAIKELESWGEQ